MQLNVLGNNDLVDESVRSQGVGHELIEAVESFITFGYTKKGQRFLWVYNF
ncbi:hypothetical protein SPFM9_00193 [Salmonella phage SPFM9]|nr:hypothetical protein SPFM9_00193 [Salmonella phage SPFM9]